MAKIFKEELNTYVFTTRYVLKGKSPIVFVSHDNDGDWQFLGPEDNLNEEDAMIVALGEIIDHDPTVTEIADLPIGKEAIRKSIGEKWQIT